MIRPALLGFSDFFDEVGAVKPPAPKPTRAVPGKPAPATPGAPAGAKPPTGKPVGTVSAPSVRKYSPPKQTTTMKKHGKVMGKAKQTLFKAARGLGRAQSLLAKRPPAAAITQAKQAMKTATAKATTAQKAAVQAKTTPSVATKRAAAVTRGAAAKAILGATVAAVKASKPVAPVVTKNLSPKAKAAVEKHNKAVTAAKKSRQALAQHALKTRKSVKALAQAAVNQKKVAKSLRTKGARRTAVGHLLHDPAIGHGVAEALGEYYELVGAAPDPMNPGYLDDGSLDPAYADPTMTDMPSLVDDSDLSLLTEEDDDTLDIINASKDLPAVPFDAATVPDYKQVGGVLYNESKGRPNGFIGSYGLMMRTTDKKNAYGVDTAASEGTDHFGYVWGQYEADGPEKGVRWGAELTPNAWNYIHGARTATDYHGWANKVDESEVLASVGKNAPSGPPFGPIIGNPALSDFKGLRMDAMGNLFWYPQEAPDWVTLPLKQAAAITEAKEKAAAEDAAKQFALEEEQRRRDEAAAQAAQDAANALAESQAASDARVAETQSQATQSAEAATQATQETAYQQQLLDQARSDAAAEAQAQQQLLEQARADAATEAQAQQLLLQRAQRQEQLLAETPELEAALMVRDAGLLDAAAEDAAPADAAPEESAAEEGGDETYVEEEAEPSYEDTTAYSEPEAESDKFRHPMQDDDYEASGFEDDGGFDDSGDDLVF